MIEVAKSTGTFSSFDGTPIYYETHGQGDPLVLCYGIVCNMNHWHYQVQDFSKKYKVILFDYRGHHKTPIPQNKNNISLEALTRDLFSLLDHLKIKKAHFMGHSWGVPLLLRSYNAQPQFFHSLVLINGFASNPFQNMLGLGDSMTALFKGIRSGYLRMPETSGSLWRILIDNPITSTLSALAGGFNLDLTAFKDIEIYSKGVANIDLSVVIPLFEQMIQYDATPILDKIKAPTLILTGEKDGVTPPHLQKKLHQGISDSQWIQVALGTHCTLLDRPGEVNRWIDEFLVLHSIN